MSHTMKAALLCTALCATVDAEWYNEYDGIYVNMGYYHAGNGYYPMNTRKNANGYILDLHSAGIHTFWGIYTPTSDLGDPPVLRQICNDAENEGPFSFALGTKCHCNWQSSGGPHVFGVMTGETRFPGGGCGNNGGGVAPPTPFPDTPAPPTAVPTATPTATPTNAPPTNPPATNPPATNAPTAVPTPIPSTKAPRTNPPATNIPTAVPTNPPATNAPTAVPTPFPNTPAPPTDPPATNIPTAVPTNPPATNAPTAVPTPLPNTPTPPANPTASPGACSTICGGTNYQGTFSHPQSGNAYGHKEDLCWELHCSSVLTIEFTRFDVESNYDSLTVQGTEYDGRTLPVVGPFTDPVVTFHFESDSSVAWEGFSFTYKCEAPSSPAPATATPVEGSCHSVASTCADGGALAYPHSGPYPANMDICWVIRCAGQAKLYFTKFELEADIDFLYINGVAYSGTKLPVPDLAYGDVHIVMQTDKATNWNGFALTHTCN